MSNISPLNLENSNLGKRAHVAIESPVIDSIPILQHKIKDILQELREPLSSDSRKSLKGIIKSLKKPLELSYKNLNSITGFTPVKKQNCSTLFQENHPYHKAKQDYLRLFDELLKEIYLQLNKHLRGLSFEDIVKHEEAWNTIKPTFKNKALHASITAIDTLFHEKKTQTVDAFIVLEIRRQEPFTFLYYNLKKDSRMRVLGILKKIFIKANPQPKELKDYTKKQIQRFFNLVFPKVIYEETLFISLIETLMNGCSLGSLGGLFYQLNTGLSNLDRSFCPQVYQYLLSLAKSSCNQAIQGLELLKNLINSVHFLPSENRNSVFAAAFEVIQKEIDPQIFSNRSLKSAIFTSIYSNAFLLNQLKLQKNTDWKKIFFANAYLKNFNGNPHLQTEILTSLSDLVVDLPPHHAKQIRKILSLPDNAIKTQFLLGLKELVKVDQGHFTTTLDAAVLIVQTFKDMDDEVSRLLKLFLKNKKIARLVLEYLQNSTNPSAQAIEALLGAQGYSVDYYTVVKPWMQQGYEMHWRNLLQSDQEALELFCSYLKAICLQTQDPTDNPGMGDLLSKVSNLTRHFQNSLLCLETIAPNLPLFKKILVLFTFHPDALLLKRACWTAYRFPQETLDICARLTEIQKSKLDDYLAFLFSQNEPHIYFKTLNKIFDEKLNIPIQEIRTEVNFTLKNNPRRLLDITKIHHHSNFFTTHPHVISKTGYFKEDALTFLANHPSAHAILLNPDLCSIAQNIHSAIWNYPQEAEKLLSFTVELPSVTNFTIKLIYVIFKRGYANYLEEIVNMLIKSKIWLKKPQFLKLLTKFLNQGEFLLVLLYLEVILGDLSPLTNIEFDHELNRLFEKSKTSPIESDLIIFINNLIENSSKPSLKKSFEIHEIRLRDLLLFSDSIRKLVASWFFCLSLFPALAQKIVMKKGSYPLIKKCINIALEPTFSERFKTTLIDIVDNSNVPLELTHEPSHLIPWGENQPILTQQRAIHKKLDKYPILKNVVLSDCPFFLDEDNILPPTSVLAILNTLPTEWIGKLYNTALLFNTGEKKELFEKILQIALKGNWDSVLNLIDLSKAGYRQEAENLCDYIQSGCKEEDMEQILKICCSTHGPFIQGLLHIKSQNHAHYCYFIDQLKSRGISLTLTGLMELLLRYPNTTIEMMVDLESSNFLLALVSSRSYETIWQLLEHPEAPILSIGHFTPLLRTMLTVLWGDFLHLFSFSKAQDLWSQYYRQIKDSPADNAMDTLGAIQIALKKESSLIGDPIHLHQVLEKLENDFVSDSLDNLKPEFFPRFWVTIAKAALTASNGVNCAVLLGSLNLRIVKEGLERGSDYFIKFQKIVRIITENPEFSTLLKKKMSLHPDIAAYFYRYFNLTTEEIHAPNFPAVAVLSSLLAHPRQATGVGSCFSIAILIQSYLSEERLLIILKDLRQVAENAKWKSEKASSLVLREEIDRAQSPLDIHPLLIYWEQAFSNLGDPRDWRFSSVLSPYVLNKFHTVARFLQAFIQYRLSTPFTIHIDTILSLLKKYAQKLLKVQFFTHRKIPNQVFYGKWKLARKDLVSAIESHEQYIDVHAKVINDTFQELCKNYPKEILSLNFIQKHLIEYLTSVSFSYFISKTHFSNASSIYDLGTDGGVVSRIEQCYYPSVIRTCFDTTSTKDFICKYLSYIRFLSTYHHVEINQNPDFPICISLGGHVFSLLPSQLLQEASSQPITQFIHKLESERLNWIPTSAFKSQWIKKISYLMPIKNRAAFSSLFTRTIYCNDEDLESFCDRILKNYEQICRIPPSRDFLKKIEILLINSIKNLPLNPYKLITIGDLNWIYHHCFNEYLSFGKNPFTKELQFYKTLNNGKIITNNSTISANNEKVYLSIFKSTPQTINATQNGPVA